MKKTLKIKPFQETLNASMCGPASLKIVLRYYGVEATEKELAKLAGNSSNLGADDKGFARAAKHFGFKVKIKNNSSFKDIEKWLDQKVPVIVNWFTRGRKDYTDSDVADGHYSVVAGLDDKFIYLQDPEIGKIRKLKRDDFMKVWFDFRGEYIKASELIIRQIIAIFGDWSIWTGPEVWQRAVREVVQKYLGKERRAGNKTFKQSGERWEDMIARSSFKFIKIKQVPIVRNWDIENITGWLFSSSFARPDYFGDQLPAFKADIKNTLLSLDLKGVFQENTSFSMVLAGREKS